MVSIIRKVESISSITTYCSPYYVTECYIIHKYSNRMGKKIHIYGLL